MPDGSAPQPSPLIAYASRTGTKRNLEALRKYGWRLLVSASGEHRSEGFPYAVDNGAWSAFQQGKPFDDAMFWRCLRSLGAGADWTVVPDIVAGGHESLALSLRWLRHVLDESPRGLLAVQDGLEPSDLVGLLGPRVGIFIGGSTAWKLRTMGAWAELARRHSAWCHVGRVNSARRIALCAAADVNSFDGTNATRFAVCIPRLSHAVAQRDLFAGARSQ